MRSQGTASTLTRSEVRGGGRKPYRQKGTGNARRGSRRSPLMPGGGISFGPKPRDWSISMNKKERRLAMATALQSAAADIVVVEDFAGAFNEVKTSALVSKLKAVGVDPSEHKTLIILNDANEQVYLSGRNLPKVAMNNANAVQVYDVLAADRIIIERSALAYINEIYGGDEEEAASA
jgi:large subunit ribosomal protein L4